MHPWPILGASTWMCLWSYGGFGTAFQPPAKVGSMRAGVASGYHCMTKKSLMTMTRSSSPKEVGASFKDAVERRLAGDGRVNPMYRQVVVVALKSATKGVGRYFNPQRDAGQTKEDARVQAKALQSQLGPLVDIVLSPAPDKVSAASVGTFLDHCEEKHGTGATLALGLLDMVWSMPAPIRPAVGEWVFAAVYEALRRYEVLSRYGALKAPDAQMPPAEEEPPRFVDGMWDSPSLSAARFGSRAQTASIGLLVLGFIGFMMATAYGDLRTTYYSLLFMFSLIFEREFLHGALFNALVQILQPSLTELTSVHEAGHVAVSYLVGCPVTTYTLGGLASLQHGEKMGSGPCCSIIDPELSVARESFIDETRLWIGDPSEPLCRESVAREVSFRHAARKNRPWGDSSGWRALAEADRDLALRERREPPSEEGRHAMANRYALSAMGGVVGETLVNGFGLGGQADEMDLRSTLRGLWPSISAIDMRSTEKWAIVEGLRALRDDREAILLLAKNMRETREMGRLLIDLERTLISQEF